MAISEVLWLFNVPSLHALVLDCTFLDLSNPETIPTRRFRELKQGHTSIVVPVHISNNHWMMAFMNVADRTVSIFDPLHRSNYRQTVWNAMQLCCQAYDSQLGGVLPPWSLAAESIRLAQGNFYDCAIYSIVVALCWMRKDPVPESIVPEIWRSSLYTALHKYALIRSNPEGRSRASALPYREASHWMSLPETSSSQTVSHCSNTRNPIEQFSAMYTAMAEKEKAEGWTNRAQQQSEYILDLISATIKAREESCAEAKKDLGKMLDFCKMSGMDPTPLQFVRTAIDSGVPYAKALEESARQLQSTTATFLDGLVQCASREVDQAKTDYRNLLVAELKRT